MASYAADWEFGSASEEQKKAHLEQYFGVSLVRQPRWATFDFIASPATVYMDLKSRRIAHDAFPTALIGRNKVDYARANPDKNFYFVYNYTDGLYYVKYDRAVFDALYCGDFLRGDRSGIVDRASPTVEIPRELLVPMRAATATT